MNLVSFIIRPTFKAVKVTSRTQLKLQLQREQQQQQQLEQYHYEREPLPFTRYLGDGVEYKDGPTTGNFVFDPYQNKQILPELQEPFCEGKG